MGSDRRKSIDSDNSTDSGSEHGHNKPKKEKKEKKDKDKKDKKDKDSKDKDSKDKDSKDKDHKDKDKKDKDKKDKDKHDKDHKSDQYAAPSFGSGSHNMHIPVMPREPSQQGQFPVPAGHPPAYPNSDFGMPREPSQQQQQPHFPQAGGAPNPPAYQNNPPPPSGFRIPLADNSTFPAQHQLGTSPCTDADGSPLYFGSALFERSVHPSKVGPHLNPPCAVAYGGVEHAHRGRFDLLPFDPQTMELVKAGHGQIPAGRRPIEGGYEENGNKLYHAIGVVHGHRVPGKTGQHLGGANVSFGGSEHAVREYELLCWR